MINRIPPELFAQQPIRSDFTTYRRKQPLRLRRYLILALLLGVVGGGGTYWLTSDSGQPEEIPTIRAEGPTKLKPDDPGGIDVPHQDEMVFQKIANAGDGQQPPVEHLLPLPQELPAAETAKDNNGPSGTVTPSTEAASPALAASSQAPTPQASPVPEVTATSAAQTPSPDPVKKEVLTPPAKEALAKLDINQVQLAEKPENETQSASPLTSTETKNVPEEKPASVASETKAPEKTKSAKESSSQEASAAAIAKKFSVQLGSFPEQSSAQTELKKLQVKYADTLGGVKLQIKKADIGGRGTFYRIQGGPMSDAQARSVCAKLWSKRAPCIVIRP